MHNTLRTAVLEGGRGGAALGVCVVVLAVLGMTPSLAWIPEVPLLGAAVLIPVGVLALTGYRAGKLRPRVLSGALASAIAGAIGGAVGGASYVVFGKPMLNVAAGVVLGAAGGAIVGAVTVILSGPTAATD